MFPIFIWLLSFAIAHPQYPSVDWNSVHRSLSNTDTVYMAQCASSSCTTIFGSFRGNISNNVCFCQCGKEYPSFLPSAKSCIKKLDECKHQITFSVYDQRSKWIPTLTIPATNNIFGSSNKILWNESGVNEKVSGTVKCVISNMFMQSDNRWTAVDHKRLFSFVVFNKSTYLKWDGNELDAQKLEGTIVQLKLICHGINNSLCLSFRIAGVQTNKNSLFPINERRWDRIELTVCFFLGVVLAFTILGSVALWNVCWRIQKSKLISGMQMQFFYYIKQQQLHISEQLAAIRANAEQRIMRSNIIDERAHPSLGIQKRKLYFSADFFEPEMLANPPQLAQQFVTELRKMIDIARERIKSKRHVPKLETITENQTEEDYLNVPKLMKSLGSAKCKNDEQSTGLNNLLNSDNNLMASRCDEPSPKSIKSTDSGCDSMSDEDLQMQSNTSDNNFINEIDRIETDQSLKQKILSPQFAKSPPLEEISSFSRIPVNSSSRMISLTLPVLLDPLKPMHLNTNSNASPIITTDANIKYAGKETVTEEAPPLFSRKPSKLEPPKIVPHASLHDANHSLPTIPKDNLVPNKRKTYAVFPSDSMLKKSLPRRAKKYSPRIIEASLPIEDSI